MDHASTRFFPLWLTSTWVTIVVYSFGVYIVTNLWLCTHRLCASGQFDGYKRALSAVRHHTLLEFITHQIMTSMIAQILLLVMATAAGINAYPHGAELAQDLASVLNQLQVLICVCVCVCVCGCTYYWFSIFQTAGSQQDTGNSQQSLSRCAPFPFHVTFNGVTYEFRDCVGKILKCSGYVTYSY